MASSSKKEEQLKVQKEILKILVQRQEEQAIIQAKAMKDKQSLKSAISKKNSMAFDSDGLEIKKIQKMTADYVALEDPRLPCSISLDKKTKKKCEKLMKHFEKNNIKARSKKNKPNLDCLQKEEKKLDEQIEKEKESATKNEEIDRVIDDLVADFELKMERYNQFLQQEQIYIESCTELQVTMTNLQAELEKTTKVPQASPEPFFSQAYKDRQSVRNSENLISQ